MNTSIVFVFMMTLSSHLSFSSAFTNMSNKRTMFSVTKPLQMTQTAAERLRKAREAAGIKDDDEDQIFSDGLLLDFQQALLSLEKRVKEGPGSLSIEETKTLENRLNNIISEMNDFNRNGGPPKESKKSGPSSVIKNVAPLSDSTPQQEARPELSNWRYEEFAKVEDPDNEEDGPAFDGKGGLGLARGTTNTYFIPNMDEMSPEEYREALQRTVIEAQRARRSKGIVGNRSSSGYLDSL